MHSRSYAGIIRFVRVCLAERVNASNAAFRVTQTQAHRYSSLTVSLILPLSQRLARSYISNVKILSSQCSVAADLPAGKPLASCRCPLPLRTRARTPFAPLVSVSVALPLLALLALFVYFSPPLPSTPLTASLYTSTVCDRFVGQCFTNTVFSFSPTVVEYNSIIIYYSVVSD